VVLYLMRPTASGLGNWSHIEQSRPETSDFGLDRAASDQDRSGPGAQIGRATENSAEGQFAASGFRQPTASGQSPAHAHRELRQSRRAARARAVAVTAPGAQRLPAPSGAIVINPTTAADRGAGSSGQSRSSSAASKPGLAGWSAATSPAEQPGAEALPSLRRFALQGARQAALSTEWIVPNMTPARPWPLLA